MFYGYTESESLRNPLILNDYKPIRVEIEYVPTSENHPYVHAYYFRFSDKEILREVKKFSRETLPEWYQLFWSKDTVYAIFKDKFFELKNERIGSWKSKVYKEVQEYGVKHGIGLVYMDFNKNFARFRETLIKYKLIKD
jgi:hypothetical protein